MTLEAQPRRPRPRPRGTDLQTRTPAAITARPTATVDRFNRAAYATAGIGALILAATAIAMRAAHLDVQSRTGLLMLTLAVLGAVMVVGGCAGGSSRPDGGNR
jgi:hypothetical protein